MKSFRGFLLLLGAAGLIFLMPVDASAQGAAPACVQEQSAQISLNSKEEDMLVGNTMSALNIARAKKAKYNQKMPIQLGNIGEARISADKIVVTTRGNAAIGCATVEQISADIVLAHHVNIASEYAQGTCVHTGLFELEDDLRQQDQEIANEMIQEFRMELMVEFGAEQERPAAPGTDIDVIRTQLEAQLSQRVRDKVAEISERLFKVRQQSDLPAYFDEILAECSGQQ